MTGYEAFNFYDRHIKGLEPNFSKTFFSEYAGTINYSAFTLPDEHNGFGLNLNNKNNATERKACFGISEIIQKSV